MIELRAVRRAFGATTALDDVSLTIPTGRFTALLGPSGCGKSTTLRLIAGLDRPTRGQILFDGVDVSARSAAERNVAMVFQSYALYPHMTVSQNIRLPLAMRRMTWWERLPPFDRMAPTARTKRAAHDEAVRRVAATMDIDGLLERKPSQLSGGQKQRVALARALVRDPSVFLLDEPLSNLDAKLRVQMRGELVDLHRRTGKTFVYVTHDQAEAMSMADQVVVMMDGRVVQVGAPREVYAAPVDTRIAAFVGEYPINLLTVASHDGRLAPPFDGYALKAPPPGGAVRLGVRPTAWRIDPAGRIRFRIDRVEYLGASMMVIGTLSDGTTVRVLADEEFKVASTTDGVRLSLDQERVLLFAAASGERLSTSLVAIDAPRRGVATGAS